jgi:uncharacterized membrane protein YgcG
MRAASSGGDRPAASGRNGVRSSAPRADASTFHFRWLFYLGCATETYALAARDWDLTRSVVALAAVLCAAAFATTGVVVAADFYLFKRAGRVRVAVCLRRARRRRRKRTRRRRRGGGGGGTTRRRRRRRRRGGEPVPVPPRRLMDAISRH